MTCIFVAGLFFIPNAQTKSITATGTIVDSTTGLPVPQAMVLLYASSSLSIDTNNLGALKLDTVFSGADGKFQHQMTVSTQAIILVYGVLKTGYQIKYNFSLIFLSTVTLGTIKISKMDTSMKDTIMVNGTVVDSSTTMGIGGALVIMTSGGGFDTTGNTVFTNANGTFSKQVIISKVNGASIVSFIITRQSYQTKLGKNTATGKQLDLGTILLKRIVDAIGTNAVVSMPRASANRMSVYTIGGRLLYAGRILPLEKIAQCGNCAVIVKLTNENTTIGMKKYVPVLK